MERDASARLLKQQRREERRQAARRRELARRLRRAGIAAAVLAVPALLAFECAGRQELAEAEVTATRPWRHFAADGSSHQHTSATLRIEGLAEASVERADGYERGQRLQVWIERGRLSGWPYFQDVATPGELESARRETEADGGG